MAPDVRHEVEVEIQYAEYLARQQGDITDFRKSAAANLPLPPDLDYTQLQALRTEEVQKLQVCFG